METQPRHYADLGQITTFDSKVFQPNSACPRCVCDFILALAVVFNDCRDLLNMNHVIASSAPEGDARINRHWGAYMGIHHHLNRLFMGLVNEFIVLIENSAPAISHPFFESIIKQLSKKDKTRWSDLISASQSKRADTATGKFIVMVRNSMAYHYSAKAIGDGYTRRFIGDAATLGPPCQSLGTNIATTRYYFADAAIEAVLANTAGKQSYHEALLSALDVLCDVAHPIKSIIHHFIIKRGGTFRELKEEA